MSISSIVVVFCAVVVDVRLYVHVDTYKVLWLMWCGSWRCQDGYTCGVVCTFFYMFGVLLF